MTEDDRTLYTENSAPLIIEFCSNTIVLKRSGEPGREPTFEQLEYAELAVNYTDGRVFMRRGDDAILDITQPLYRVDGGRLVYAATTSFIVTEDGRTLYTENDSPLAIERYTAQSFATEDGNILYTEDALLLILQ